MYYIVIRFAKYNVRGFDRFVAETQCLPQKLWPHRNVRHSREGGVHRRKSANERLWRRWTTIQVPGRQSLTSAPRSTGQQQNRGLDRCGDCHDAMEVGRYSTVYRLVLESSVKRSVNVCIHVTELNSTEWNLRGRVLAILTLTCWSPLNAV